MFLTHATKLVEAPRLPFKVCKIKVINLQISFQTKKEDDKQTKQQSENPQKNPKTDRNSSSSSNAQTASSGKFVEILFIYLFLNMRLRFFKSLVKLGYQIK